MLQHFGKEPMVVGRCCRRKLDFVNKNTEEYPSMLGACVDEFLHVLDQSKDSNVWQVYVNFLLDEKSKTEESTIAQYLDNCLDSVLQEASSRQLMTPAMYLAWFEVTKAPKKLKTALKHYPENIEIWKKYIDTSQDKLEAFRNALTHLPTSPDLWEDYLNYLKEKQAKNVRKEFERCVQQFLNTSFETRMLLGYLDLFQGAELVQQYKKYMDSKQQPLAFFEYLIERELATSSDQMDFLFQRAHDAYPTNTRILPLT
jgi:hypothetical protein